MSDGWMNEKLPDMSFNHGVLKQNQKCDVMWSCVLIVIPFANKHTTHDLNEMMMMKWLLLNQSNHQREMWKLCSSLLWNVDDCVVVIVTNIKPNQESNTFFHIESNEGRECASETIHACARLKYDCGHVDSIPGRTPRFVIPLNKSPTSIPLISE